jgi:hypothetical protein
MESILPVAVIPIVPIPNRPSRRKTISIPSVRRKVCARRSRPASVRGFFGQPAHFPTMGLPATLVPARKRSDALPIHCARSAMSSRTRAASGAPVAFETGGVASRRSWAATTQVHIDENHGTLRRVETIAAGAKSSPACSSASNQDGDTRRQTYLFFSFALAVLPRTTFAATRWLCALPGSAERAAAALVRRTPG